MNAAFVIRPRKPNENLSKKIAPPILKDMFRCDKERNEPCLGRDGNKKASPRGNLGCSICIRQEDKAYGFLVKSLRDAFCPSGRGRRQ